MIRRPPRSTLDRSSAASDVYKRQRHSKTHPWYLDLRPFNQGRKFFKTKAEAEAERLRQITTLARHGRAAVGLPQRVLSDFIAARDKLAEYGKTINDALGFFVDHLE